MGTRFISVDGDRESVFRGPLDGLMMEEFNGVGLTAFEPEDAIRVRHKIQVLPAWS